MPQTEIDISCPGCNAVFSVPVELCGETAECTECSAVFEIPKIEEIPPTLNTDTGAIKGIPAPVPGGDNTSAATNTVKLSRASIGMIPSLKDNFNLGQNAPRESGPGPKITYTPPKQNAAPTTTVSAPQPPPPAPQVQPKLSFAKPSAPQPPPPAKTAPAPTVQAPAQAVAPQQPAQRKPSSTQTSIAIQQVALDSLLPAWTKVQLKDGEEFLDFQKLNKNPVLPALLVSLPVLLTIAATFFPQLLALIIVLVIWIITFVIAFMMTKKSSNNGVIITNQRIICIIGKDKVELNK